MWIRQAEGEVVPFNWVFWVKSGLRIVSFYCVPVDGNTHINPKLLSLQINLLIWKWFLGEKRLGPDVFDVTTQIQFSTIWQPQKLFLITARKWSTT